MTFYLTHFNSIDTTSLDHYYKAEINFNGRSIQIDLNFNSLCVNEERLIDVRNYLDNLESVHNAAIKAVYEDLHTGEGTIEFLNFHIEELDEADMQIVTAHSDKSQSIEYQILSQLQLKRIGFYPEAEEYFATLDFTIGEEVSQYLLVVKMNNKQVIEEITMES